MITTTPALYDSNEIDALYREAQLDDLREQQELYGRHPEHAPAAPQIDALDEDDDL